jgi:hypothetical protein
MVIYTKTLSQDDSKLLGTIHSEVDRSVRITAFHWLGWTRGATEQANGWHLCRHPGSFIPRAGQPASSYSGVEAGPAAMLLVLICLFGQS